MWKWIPSRIFLSIYSAVLFFTVIPLLEIWAAANPGTVSAGAIHIFLSGYLPSCYASFLMEPPWTCHWTARMKTLFPPFFHDDSWLHPAVPKVIFLRASIVILSVQNNTTCQCLPVILHRLFVSESILVGTHIISKEIAAQDEQLFTQLIFSSIFEKYNPWFQID